MTPLCPWCGSRMLPQVTEEKLVSYRCTNKACLAVSPHAGTFHDAADKAVKRAEKPLKWHDRESDPPKKPGVYLCEYVFSLDKKHLPFHGLYCWYTDEQRFEHEKENGLWHGQELIVVRWLDFKEEAAQ